MFKTHLQIINAIAKKIKAKTYLEIGINDPTKNFDLVKVDHKVGVDPFPKLPRQNVFRMTSDDFFKDYGGGYRFDLVFIDGLHHYDQVKRDFFNALARLSPSGYIVIHDTNPQLESYTHVPRDKKGRWTGDVYRFACELAGFNGINFATVNIETGVTIVWMDKKIASNVPTRNMKWLEFKQRRGEYLRLISPEAFTKAFK